MKTIQVENLNKEELKQLIKEAVSEIDSENKTAPKKQEFLSRESVAKHLKASLVTIDKWSRMGILKKYYIGGKVQFKLSEIEEAMSQTKSIKYKHKGFKF